MITYTITITGVFDAETEAEALDEFRQWVTMPGCLEQGATVTAAVAYAYACAFGCGFECNTVDEMNDHYDATECSS
jgi:hypothetical protein